MISGTLVNPLLTKGQVQGGLAQGIGQALHEHTVYDASGQLLTASFMDYGLPRAADLPGFELHFNPVPSEANPLGVKGSGQAGCIAAPQTVMNAIVNAPGSRSASTMSRCRRRRSGSGRSSMAREGPRHADETAPRRARSIGP